MYAISADHRFILYLNPHPPPFHSPPLSIILLFLSISSLSLSLSNPNLLPSSSFIPFCQSSLKKRKRKKEKSRSGAIHDVTQLTRVTD